MRAHKLLTLLALVILLLTLMPDSVWAMPAGPEARLAPPASPAPAPSTSSPKARDLTPPEGGAPERNPGIESLSGSNVTFNPAAGGATCFTPGATQTFCFDAYTQTNDWEWVYNVWISFPSGWTVTNAYVVGTPSCTGGGTWDEMSWSFETTPYAINIGHTRYQETTDSCLATYCVDVVAGTGAPDAMASWYWSGDGYGNPPHHPCSSDQYTPPSMTDYPCDEWTQPQAAVPPCGPVPVPDITVTPPALSQELCSDQTGAQQLLICNTGDWLLTWQLSEVSPTLKLDSIQVTLPAGPAAAPAGTAVSAGPYTARPASRYTVERRAGINAAPNVLLLAADGANIIQGLLQAYGDLGTVDYYDARFATPSLAELAAYDVVVTWSNHVYADPTAIGNVLADYVDTGGKVVNLNFSVGTHGWQMAGRFITENYTAMKGGDFFYTTACLGTYSAGHPIMFGVTNACDHYRISGTYLTSGSSDIAQWADGLLFVAAKDNQTVVSINGYVGNLYLWTGQMPDVLHNAIVWLAGPDVDIPWLSETPMWGAVAPGECATVTVTFDSTGLAPGDYYAGLLITSNDPDEPQVTVPVTLTVLAPADVLSVTYTTANLLVAFDATAVGGAPLTYAWDFGDGGTSDLEDPTYTYAAGGCYTVTLVVSNDCGQDTWTGQVCVCDPAHNAEFTWSPTSPVVDETVTFIATALGTGPFIYTWAFGDGATGSGQTATHAYAGTGTYTVTLTVDNACGTTMVAHALTVIAPDIEVSAPPLDTSLCPNATDTISFTICNVGTSPLTWDVSESPIAGWLSESPTSGTLSPSDCVDVGVTFDATGLVPGDYTANLVIASDDPDEPSVGLPASLTVLQPADITSVTYTATNLQVAFDATATGEPPLTYAWDFGDGGTSDLEDPTHTYAVGGCYPVTLVVSGGCGQDTWTGQVCVCDPVNSAEFTWSPTVPLVDEIVTFIAATPAGTGPFTYSWVFGDGATGSGQTATHAYAGTGTYTVTLTVDNACGTTMVAHALTVIAPDIEVSAPPLDTSLCPNATDTISFTICNVGTSPLTWDVSESPIAGWLSESPTSGTLSPSDCVDVGVTFDATGLVPGDYTANLVIATDDPDEPSVGLPASLTVFQPADITGMTYTATSLQVAFDATATGEPPLTYAWDLGDGGTSDLEDPVHDYGASGCYTVTLVVTNGCGTDTWTEQVCVCQWVGNLDFTWLPEPPKDGQIVTFAATADGATPITFDWDFGDGTIGAGQNPTHTYATPGSYPVTVMATNCDGRTDTQSHTLTVRPSRLYYYLPIVVKGFQSAWNRPDLVGSFTVIPDQTMYRPEEEILITVVITNQGTAVAGGFWVDFYMNPDPVPTGPGLPWMYACGLFPCYGITWQVPAGLAPGESVTLTSAPGGYYAPLTVMPGHFAPGTTDLYLFIDSWEPSTTWGAVLEMNETNNRAERHGLIVPRVRGQAPEVPPQLPSR